jgi:23S rRNA (cytidine1920-2'-O)/16S rRNA (cytidine1409-2'-O)-methyltransferase
MPNYDSPVHRPSPFVSRAGMKLDHALREFNIDVTGFTCADFGCNVGGFTDCLLQRGAARVYAIDTGYGVLAWTLRNDPRVVVMERANALHVPPPLATGAGSFSATKAPTGPYKIVTVPNLSNVSNLSDLVVIDLAWTPQRLAMPAALRWLKPEGRIITLVKPHYELTELEKTTLLVDGFLDPAHAETVLQRILNVMPAWGAAPLAHTRSPLTGGKSSKGRGGEGNVEFLVLAQPIKADAAQGAV